MFLRSTLVSLAALTMAGPAWADDTPAGLPASVASLHGKCPTGVKGDPVVYGVGGSTMGSVLGPMLKTVFGEHHVALNYWGKASSGLARPDFHDWPKVAPRTMKERDPDIVIVSLGTNDYQALWDKGNWISQDDAAWETTYAARVDALLEGLAGPDKRRLVIWSGPYAFAGKNAEARAPIVNRIMKERVEAFAAAGGRAVFHDAFALTADDHGKPIGKRALPGHGDKAVGIRGKDNIHLTAQAVRSLFAEPIVALSVSCFPGHESGVVKKAP